MGWVEQLVPFTFFGLRCLQHIEDLSDGCGAKFSCLVVSSKFEGKPLLQRHRLCISCLFLLQHYMNFKCSKNYCIMITVSEISPHAVNGGDIQRSRDDVDDDGIHIYVFSKVFWFINCILYIYIFTSLTNISSYVWFHCIQFKLQRFFMHPQASQWCAGGGNEDNTRIYPENTDPGTMGSTTALMTAVTEWNACMLASQQHQWHLMRDGVGGRHITLLPRPLCR